MQYETIETKDAERARWVTLNRPKVYNAFNLPQYRELRAALLEAEADDAIRCVVISGAGKNFSAGNDLTAARSKSGAKTYSGPRGFITIGNETCWTIWRLKKPVIAAVEGFCLGGGFELAMACDFVLADPGACFGEPEVRVADAPPFFITPWIMGMRQAKHLLLTGDVITASTALSYGILTELCKPGQLEDRVKHLAGKMAAFPPETWYFNKQGVNRVYEIMGFHASIDLGVDIFATIKTTPNALRDELTERIDRDGFASAIKWAQARYPS
ncbi:MAG: enoyl-CoA hydratase/isomerase family protein [Bradyrhizobium sp.]